MVKPNLTFFAVMPRKMLIAIIMFAAIVVCPVAGVASGCQEDASAAPEYRLSEIRENVLSISGPEFLLDFDSGQTIDSPANAAADQLATMDIAPSQAAPGDVPDSLRGNSLMGMAASQSAISATAGEIRQQMSAGNLLPLERLPFESTMEGESTATFFFRTASGTSGVLQLTDVIDDPAGMKIRYRVLVPGSEDANGESAAATPLPTDLRYTDSFESIWEFGIEATAGGDARSILATAPVPVQWPEQLVEIIAEDKSDNVARISFKDIGDDARQMVIKINRLSQGETARAVVRVKISKRMTLAPADPRELSLPERLPSKMRKYLRPSPLIESDHERIEEIAESLGTDSGLTDWEKVEEIFDWVRANIEYKFADENYSCLQALDQGHGDCGELSSLFIAICRAKGIAARAVWLPGHTYPEFYMEDAEGNGHWIPCQAAGTREFGAMSDINPILQKGDSFKLPGYAEPLRYIQPTLTAKEAPGGIELIHVTESITQLPQSNTLQPQSTPPIPPTRPSLMNRPPGGQSGG